MFGVTIVVPKCHTSKFEQGFLGTATVTYHPAGFFKYITNATPLVRIGPAAPRAAQCVTARKSALASTRLGARPGRPDEEKRGPLDQGTPLYTTVAYLLRIRQSEDLSSRHASGCYTYQARAAATVTRFSSVSSRAERNTSSQSSMKQAQRERRLVRPRHCAIAVEKRPRQLAVAGV